MLKTFCCEVAVAVVVVLVVVVVVVENKALRHLSVTAGAVCRCTVVVRFGSKARRTSGLLPPPPTKDKCRNDIELPMFMIDQLTSSVGNCNPLFFLLLLVF